MRAPALAAVALLAAGCLSSGGPEGEPAAGGGAPFVPPEPDFDFSGVVDPDHAAHEAPALHGAGHGLALVGHAGVQDLLPLGTRGSITQVDVWGDLAAVSGMEGGLAFALVDISDPAAPRPVGWFPSTADGWTARFSDDGRFVFYGCQMFGAPYAAANEVRGTCEDPEALHAPASLAGGNPPGVVAVDVNDPAHPAFVDFLATPGSHNLVTAHIAGADYVFTSAVTILRFDRAAGELVQVAEVPGVHDAAVARHPVTGDWLLFTGTGELTIYNVNDPANPTLVYEGDGSGAWTGWHEQTLVPGLVDGRAILLLAGETFCHGLPQACATGERLPDTVSVVDVTDPARPTPLGQWQPPFTPRTPWLSYLFSVHEMAATPTGQVAIAWYHGGAWVIDVSTAERQAAPVTLAGYQPHGDVNVLPAAFPQVPLPYVPFTWGAGWDDRGYLVVPDMHTGLYVLEPDWGLVPGLDGGQ